MASRKRLASWSTALSHERVAWEEAEDEQLAAERQVEELQDQIAEVEAEREGLESRLAAVGAKREARAEAERDLEEALEQVQTTEELTTSLQAPVRGGESARSQAPPGPGHGVGGVAGTWSRTRSSPYAHHPLLLLPSHVSWMHALAAEVGGEAETIPAETIPADEDVLALVIRVTEAPALNCWSCSMYEWMKLQGSRVHPHVL